MNRAWIVTWLVVIGVILFLWLAIPAHCQEATMVQIRDFSGGLVTDFDTYDMEPKYGTVCNNFEIGKGSLELRQGYRKWLSLLVGSRPALRPQRIYSMSISEPNFYGKPAGGKYTTATDGLSSITQGGQIYLIAGLDTSSGKNVQTLYMYPDYDPVDITNHSDPAWGDWDATFSADLNTQTNWWDRLFSSRWGDGVIANGTMRIATGAQSTGDSTFTYPMWFGYIGGWHFHWHSDIGSNYGKSDDFYLLPASLFPPDTAIVLNGKSGYADSTFKVAKTRPSGPDGIGLGTGRYWFKIAYEYDGFQYSAPVGDSSWHIDFYGADSMIQIGVQVPLPASGVAPNRRVTALIIFTTDSIGTAMQNYYMTGGLTKQEVQIWEQPVSPPFIQNPFIKTIIDNPIIGSQHIAGLNGITFNTASYYFRKRVVIRVPDSLAAYPTSNPSFGLGYGWKGNASTGNGGQIGWTDVTGQSGYISIWIDRDDMAPAMPDMWTYLGQNSNENIVCMEHLAYVNGYAFAGDVLIDNPTSKIKKRYRNMVIVSPYGQLDAFPINNMFTVGGGSGSYVTAMREWDGKCLIWTNDALEIWSGGSPPTRMAQYVGMGSNAPRSIQITPSGIFYANSSGIYQYDGQATPKLISAMVSSAFEDLWGTDTNTGQSTLPYALSAFFPQDQQYALICNTTVAGRPDTIVTPTYWGNIKVPKKYGGSGALVYNIPFQSWMTWTWTQPMRDMFSGTDGLVYGVQPDSGYLCKMKSESDSAVWYDGLMWSYAGALTHNYSCAYSGNWTDLGYPGMEKEISQILLDYQLDCSTDTLSVNPHYDGESAGTSYLRVKFPYYTDAHYRILKSKFPANSQTTYPPGANPALYYFSISAGATPDSSKANAYKKVYGLNVWVLPRGVRQ